MSAKGRSPCLTAQQRADLAQLVARRKELLAKRRQLTAERSRLYQEIRKLTAELDGIPLLKELAASHGVSYVTIANARKHKYRNVNPLDAQSGQA